MSNTETTHTAWEPFRDAWREPQRNQGLLDLIKQKRQRILTESDPEFIGPRTSGEFSEETLCEGCLEGFVAKVYVLRLHETFRMKYCGTCQKAREELSRIVANHAPTRTQLWSKICPASYLNTDLGRIVKEGKLKATKPEELPCAVFVKRFLERELSDRGAGLVGPSRFGKTRLMFALLGKYYLAGARVNYLFAPDFSDIYAGLMGESAAKGNSFLESCINADVWFLDDLGKGRLSESAQRALLRIVEKRTSNLRPIFTTSNQDGNALIAKMRYEDGSPSEYAEPMIERLREFGDFFMF